MTPELRTLMHRMLDAVGPMRDLSADDMAHVSFALLVKALADLEDAEYREFLLSSLETAARDRVACLVHEALH